MPSTPATDAATLSPQETQQKVDEYTQFLDRVLRPELKEARRLVEETQHDIDEYLLLKKTLQQQQHPQQDSSPPLLVDLGYQSIYCQARYDKDPSEQVFIDVGLGFHVEMTAAEAINFIDQRIQHLQDYPKKQRQQRLIAVQDHLQSSLNILEELYKVQQQHEQ
jgi:prefoldin subunit 5